MTLDAEDGETTIFGRVGSYSTDDTASYHISTDTDFSCRPTKEILLHAAKFGPEERRI
jgi:hypothetical protein